MKPKRLILHNVFHAVYQRREPFLSTFDRLYVGSFFGYAIHLPKTARNIRELMGAL
jgi:hypothetical protein